VRSSRLCLLAHTGETAFTWGCITAVFPAILHVSLYDPSSHSLDMRMCSDTLHVIMHDTLNVIASEVDVELKRVLAAIPAPRYGE
jgi:hypothetical protein